MRSKLFIFAIISLLLFGYCTQETSYGQVVFMFSDYINPNESIFQESCVKATFEINTSYDGFIKDFFNKSDFKINSYSEKEINFSNKDIIGDIVRDKSRIVLQLSTNKKAISTSKMKALLERNVGLKGTNLKVYEYYKFKLKNESTENAKIRILKQLQMKKAENIETGILNGGEIYSIVANTGKFDEMIIDNKNIDINIAISSYKSGNYILIGTPIIPVSY